METFETYFNNNTILPRRFHRITLKRIFFSAKIELSLKEVVTDSSHGEGGDLISKPQYLNELTV